MEGADLSSFSRTLTWHLFSGQLVTSEWNHRVLAIALSLGILASIKRLWLGLLLGRKTYCK